MEETHLFLKGGACNSNYLCSHSCPVAGRETGSPEASQPPSSRQGQPVPGLGDSTGDGKEGTEIKKARKEVGKAR